MIKGLLSSLLEKVKSHDAFLTNEERSANAFKRWFYENEVFLSVFDKTVKKRYREHFKPSSIQDKYTLATCCVQSVLIRWLIENDYVKKLKLKEKQLTYRDDYGDWDFDDWYRELDKFTKKRKRDFHRYYLQYHPEEITNFYKNTKPYHIEFYHESDSYGDPCLPIHVLESDLSHLLLHMFPDDEIEDDGAFDSDDPYEYEKYVAESISKYGWDARVTKGSGDQGVDVIAVNGEQRVAIQCKLYNQPVGNKAVQEAHAGMGFYGCNVSAVVTNHTFSKSARQLASSLDVILIEHSQVQDFFGDGLEDEYQSDDSLSVHSRDTTEIGECHFEDTIEKIQFLYSTNSYSEGLEPTKEDNICLLCFCRNKDIHKVMFVKNDEYSFEFLMELLLSPLELDGDNIVRILIHSEKLSQREILEVEKKNIIPIPSTRLDILSNIV